MENGEVFPQKQNRPGCQGSLHEPVNPDGAGSTPDAEIRSISHGTKFKGRKKARCSQRIFAKFPLSVNKTSHSLYQFDADIGESSSLNSPPPAIPNWETEDLLPKGTSKHPQVPLLQAGFHLHIRPKDHSENGLCQIMHPFFCVW